VTGNGTWGDESSNVSACSKRCMAIPKGNHVVIEVSGRVWTGDVDCRGIVGVVQSLWSSLRWMKSSQRLQRSFALMRAKQWGSWVKDGGWSTFSRLRIGVIVGCVVALAEGR